MFAELDAPVGHHRRGVPVSRWLPCPFDGGGVAVVHEVEARCLQRMYKAGSSSARGSQTFLAELHVCYRQALRLKHTRYRRLAAVANHVADGETMLGHV